MGDDNQKDIENLGTDRQKAHPNGTKRYYENENLEDIIGIAGEIAFGKKYNLIPDTSIRPEGDGHVDFKISFQEKKIITFDIKTAQKAYNLLIKEWEIDDCADCLILAEYKEGNIKFLGWTTKKIMKSQPKKTFSTLKIINYYLHQSKLYSMERIDKFFTNNTDKIKQILNTD